MTTLDWVLVGFAAFAAIGGYRRGLVGSVLALAGLVIGAVVGARVAPQLLSAGTGSDFTGLIALVGALVGAGLGRVVASVVGSFVRGGLRLLAPLHLLDSLGGLAAGAASGLVLIWVLGAVALQLHGHPEVRREVRQSEVLRRLDRIASPDDLLRIQVSFAGTELPHP